MIFFKSLKYFINLCVAAHCMKGQKVNIPISLKIFIFINRKKRLQGVQNCRLSLLEYMSHKLWQFRLLMQPLQRINFNEIKPIIKSRVRNQGIALQGKYIAHFYSLRKKLKLYFQSKNIKIVMGTNNLTDAESPTYR